MKKKLFVTIAVTGLAFLIFSMPAVAAVYKYTGSSFRYVGNVFHEKEISFTGGSVGFQVTGQGMAQGSHDLHSASDSVYEGEWFNKVNVAIRFTGATAADALDDQRMRILSMMNISQTALVQVGVEMEQGESGYINQNAASIKSSDGSYTKIENHFGNTGGITRRNTEFKGFMNESMSVEGYAEVWESTTVRSGSAMTGWWDTKP
jgi:hypothetical protein